MYTQIIKNITSLSMHLLLLTCHSSSTNDHMQLSFTREKSLSLLKSIIMNACSSKTPKIRKLSTNVIKCVLESVHAPLKVHVFTLPFLDFILTYFQAINPISTDTFEFTTSNTIETPKFTTKFTSTKTTNTMKTQAQEKMLDALVCLRVIMPVLVKQSAGCSNVATKLEFLCKYLLSLPVTSDGILTRWVFTVLSMLFAPTTNQSDYPSAIDYHLDTWNQLSNLSTPVVVGILNQLRDMKPHVSNTLLTPVWMDLTGKSLSHLLSLVFYYESFSSTSEKNSHHDTIFFTTLEKNMIEQLKPILLTDHVTSVFQLFLSSYLLVKPSTPLSKAKKGKKEKSLSISDNTDSTLVHRVALQSLQDIIILTAKIPSIQNHQNQDRTLNPIDKMARMVLNQLQNVLVSEQWGDLLILSTAFFQTGRYGWIESNREPSFIILELVSHIMKLRDDPAYMTSFPFKYELEKSIQSAICGLGVDCFFQHVPLAIDFESGYKEGSSRRPYLITSLIEAFTVSPLPTTPIEIISQGFRKGQHVQSISFFLTTLLPLMNRLYAKEKSGKSELESKLYSTMLDQCWTVLPLLVTPLWDPYCLPFDFHEQWPVFVAVLGGVVSGGEGIECMGSDSIKCVLKTLNGICTVFSKWKVSDGSESGGEGCEWKNQCRDGFREYVPRFLSAICNLYMTRPSIEVCKNKGTSLQVEHERQMQFLAIPITQLLGIMDTKKVVDDYFLVLVRKALMNQERRGDYSGLDLMMLFLPFVQVGSGDGSDGDSSDWMRSPLGVYYQVLVSKIRVKDATLQKKTYKSLVHLFQHPSRPLEKMDDKVFQEFSKELVDDQVVAGVSSGAIKHRVLLIQLIVEKSCCFDDEMKGERVGIVQELIPLFLAEVMLATKESNEKTRDAAYGCLICFAKFMMRLPLVVEKGDGSGQEGMEVDQVEEGNQRLREIFLMVTAGLGGETPHMQSAAIATLGRMFFEFHQELPTSLVSELLETILTTMSFRNREVTKAALGFVKVCVVCMDPNVVKKHTGAIIESILQYTHRVHKSHFKSKARHLFERLIRKFGYEFVDGHVPEQDKKLIVNIRKRREAAAKRKMESGMGHNETTGESGVGKIRFEEAFHDSESELGSDDDEKYIPNEYRNINVGTKKDKKRKGMTVIHENEDQVVDFLDRNVVSQVTHQLNGLKTVDKDGSEYAMNMFKTGSNGRLVIAEEHVEEEGRESQKKRDGNGKEGKQEEISEDYYKQSLASEVSFTRTADGRVKFLKRKRGERDDAQTTYENGSADREVGKRWNSGYKNGRKDGNGGKDLDYNEMLGRQYKAKKARGDVKKAGMADPYAYIPLSGKIVGNMSKSTKLDGTLKGVLKATTKGTSAKPEKTFKPKMKGTAKGNKKHNK